MAYGRSVIGNGIVIRRRAPSKTRPEAAAAVVAVSRAFPPVPEEDLVFRGGKVIPNLSFKNFYIGTYWQSDVGDSDRININKALRAAMSDERLNNVIRQYFANHPITSAMLDSVVLPSDPPSEVAKSDVRQLAAAVFQKGALAGLDLDNTVLNFVLPPKVILSSDEAIGARNAAQLATASQPGLPEEEEEDSLHGLGGYHGSTHIASSGGQRVTLYYAVGAYSNFDPDKGDNGIPIPGWEPWMNIVATFYHELNEARTDPDVEDAVRNNDRRFIGWNADSGKEIGDFPIEEAGEDLPLVFQKVKLADGSGEVPIQLMYSNAVHGPQGPVKEPLPIAGLDTIPAIGSSATAARATSARPALEKFSPPALLAQDFTKPEMAAAWSGFISDLFDQAIDRTHEFLQGRPPQFYNPIKTPPAGTDGTELPILWQGFPKSLERAFGVGTRRTWQTAEQVIGTHVARQQFQDEYLEWFVTRDPNTSKIIKVEFTCEGPEYWAFLAKQDPDTVLELYRANVNSQVRADDLFQDGVYNPLNPWNLTRGAMHLIQPNNTLSAEIFIAADATILRHDASGNLITDAADLIGCAGFGEKTRASDPHIGDEVNGLARQGYTVTLTDPVGLYMESLDTTGWTKPDGSPVGDYFRITRGDKAHAVRAVYAVPEGERSAAQPFAVGDILIGGVPIEFGGQIAKNITMRLTGFASGKGMITSPAFGCGGPPQVTAQLRPTASRRRIIV
jgi:hypothetical protein